MSSYAGAWSPKSSLKEHLLCEVLMNAQWKMGSPVSGKHGADKDVVASPLEWGAYCKPMYFQGWGLGSLVIFVSFQSLGNFFRVLWASWDTLLLSEGKEYRGSRYTRGPNRRPNIFWHRSPIFISDGATFQAMKFGEHCCRWMLTFCQETGNVYAKNQSYLFLLIYFFKPCCLLHDRSRWWMDHQVIYLELEYKEPRTRNPSGFVVRKLSSEK